MNVMGDFIKAEEYMRFCYLVQHNILKKTEVCRLPSMTKIMKKTGKVFAKYKCVSK